MSNDNDLNARWFYIEQVLASGRKILTFVDPNQNVTFRSKKAVFEFLKYSCVFSVQDLKGFAMLMNIKRE